MNFKSKLPLLFFFLSVVLTSTLAVALPNNQEEARLELKQCMKHCLNQQDLGEQRECIQVCHQGYKERQHEDNARWGGGGYIMELIDAMINPSSVDKGHSSDKEYKQCLINCAMGATQTVDEVYECDIKCVEKHKGKRDMPRGDLTINIEERNKEKARLGSYNIMELFDAMMKTRDGDPKKELEKCQLDCVIEAKGGVSKEMECVKKCDEKYQEKQEIMRSQSADKGHSSDKDYKQCLINCAMGATHTVDQVYECDIKCVEKHKGKRDIPRGDLIINLEEGKKENARLGSYNNMELLDSMVKTRNEDPKKDLEKCQLDCVIEAKGGVSKEMECVKKCDEDYKKKQERQSFNLDDDNESKRLECQSHCVSGAMHTYMEIYECEKKCFENYPPHQRERRREGPIITRGRQSSSEHYSKEDKEELKECLINCAMGAKHTVAEVYACDLKCTKFHPKKREGNSKISRSIVELTAGLF